MKNLYYSQIYNYNLNNKTMRKAIYPNATNFNKININSNHSNIRQNSNNLNFNKINSNPNYYKQDNKCINYQNKKIKPINTYKNILSLTQRRDNMENDIKSYQGKNISLNKIQSEIKMIEIKLRSDIIKNKIKRLNDISNDNKNKKYQINMPNNRFRYIDINNDNNSYLYNYKKFNNNNIINKNSFIEQKEKERKTYRIKKLKINNNKNSVKFYIRKRNINLTDNNLGDYENNFFFNTDINNNVNNNYYNNKTNNREYIINKQYNTKSEKRQNYSFKINKNENIKKNNDIFQSNKKLYIINMKNSFINSNKDNKKFLIKSPSYVVKNIKKNLFNNDNDIKKYTNTNYSYRNFNVKDINNNNLINNNIKYSYDRNNNQKRSFVTSTNESNVKNLGDYYLSGNLPQGPFDQYFINNYNIKNINKTTIYNTIDSKYDNSNEKKDKDKIKEILKIGNINNLYIKSNPLENKLKKSLELQKEKKIIDFSYISSDKNNNKTNLKDQINSNNKIINTVNFSFNPIKITLKKQMSLLNDSIDNNKSDKIDKKFNININKNSILNKKDMTNKKKINNQQIKNNNINIENYINKYNEKKREDINNSIKKEEEQNKTNEIILNSYINSDKKDNNCINNRNEEKNKEENEVERKKIIPFLDPNELEQKTIILNKSIDLFGEENEENNEKKNGKKVLFDDKKIIIEYYQNDYIKKSYIYSSNDSKKIKHNYILTKIHIKNLKKQNNKKSILLVNKNNNINNDNSNRKSEKNKERKILNSELALLKLNELISEEVIKKEKNIKTNKNNKNRNEKNNIKEHKINNSIITPSYIQKNIDYIKKIQDYNKKGLNYKVLSKSEIKLLNKKKKNMCYKFQKNPQHFFTEELCENVIKSFGFDDSDLLRLSKKQLIKKKLSRSESDLKKHLKYSLSEDFRLKKISMI